MDVQGGALNSYIFQADGGRIKGFEGLKHEDSGHLIRDDVVRHVLLLRDNT